jgi:hypothetical protein
MHLYCLSCCISGISRLFCGPVTACNGIVNITSADLEHLPAGSRLSFTVSIRGGLMSVKLKRDKCVGRTRFLSEMPCVCSYNIQHLNKARASKCTWKMEHGAAQSK